MSRNRVKAALLVLDYSIYPRHHVDRSNLQSLRAALEAGVRLPPVVADSASLRVVDGFHRVTVALEGNPESEIAVDLRDYPSESEMLLDAARLNSGHGARLTTYDHARVLALADLRSIPRDAIAAALRIPVDKAESIRRSRTAYTVDGKPLQIKRAARHLAGTQLNPAQVAANERSQGFPLRFHCDQIRNAIEGGLVDWSDPSETDALRQLAGVLETHLGARTE